MWSKLPILIAIPVIAALVATSNAQEKEQEEIDQLRQEKIAKFGGQKLLSPESVSKMATSIFAKPLDEQTRDELISLADDANRVANLLSVIVDRYGEYYRDNYRYDFVQEKVGPFHDSFVEESNKFKYYRNNSYYNLGIKSAKEGNDVEAYFYFRDSFRLSSFTEPSGDHKGMRYKAEMEIKKLLGMEKLGTYVYWQ